MNTKDAPAAFTSTLDEYLAGLLAEGFTCMGEVAISARGVEYELRHRDDAHRNDAELQTFSQPEDAEEIARYDDAGAFRPLKTAPNLRHGWRLEVAGIGALRLALECLYPGRLGAIRQWKNGSLPVTPLRETLGRQTGMYRITQKLTDEQAVAMTGRFCRSDGGCARTILWRLNADDTENAALRASLPAEKFDPACDQILAGRAESVPAATAQRSLPMFCQEACNLLVAEARLVVKGTKSAS